MYSISNLLSKAQSLRIDKSSSDVITISFTLLKQDADTIPDKYHLFIEGGVLEFKLASKSSKGLTTYVSYKYNPYEDLTINKTIKFITVSKKVKDFFDDHMMTEPYISSYESANALYKVKIVNDLYGISGWYISEILDELKNVLNIYIDGFSLPSSMNYRVTNFTIRQGSNLLQALKGLFPNFAVNVIRFGDEFVITNNFYRMGSEIRIAGEVCEEDEFELLQLKLDNLFIFGDNTEPLYIKGVPGKIIDMEDTVNKFFKLKRKEELNLIGRRYATLEMETQKIIKLENF